jgi:hypothetical protein
MKTLKIFSLAFLFVASLVGCSGTTSTNSTTAFYCTVSSATPISGTNQATLYISAYNGTANYTLSSVALSGTSGSVTSGTTTFSSYLSPTVQFSSLTSSSILGATGTVTITDASSSPLSTSCSFTVGSTSSTTTSNTVACSATAASYAPAVGVANTYNFTASGGTAPYTFSNFTPGNYGTTTTALYTASSTQAVAAASYSSAGTVTPSVTVTDANGYTNSCSTTITVGSSTTTSGSYPTCSLSHYVSGNLVYLYATASSGEALTFTSISPGSEGVYTAGGNPSLLTYSYTGTKTITAYARSVSTGLACNAGAALTDSVYITAGTGSAYLACSAVISPNPSTHGQYVAAYATITAAGSGNARLISVTYPSAAAVSGYYTGSLSTSLLFPVAGTWEITMIVQDSAGNTASCTTNQVVY